MVMLDAISDCLRQMNVDFIRIDGSTRNDVRTMHVKRFQEKNSCLAAVLSIKACNSGITLTAAQLVIFAELDWNPSILAQAESRAHRVGQEGTVMCRYLLAKGTADDFISEMLKTKEKTLIKAGIFNEALSEAENVSIPSTSVVQTTTHDQMMGSQSSLDDAIANMCTDEMIVQCSDQVSEQTENVIQEEKENKISQNDLKGLLEDDGDENFLALNF